MPAGATREVVLAKLNEVRAANWVDPLRYDLRLEAAAQRQAELMAQQDLIAHELGKSLRARVSAAGYHETVGEILAGGQDTLEGAIAGWLRSPSHRATLLNAKFTAVGFAVVSRPDGKWGTFWAVIFGGETEAFLEEP